MERPAAYFSRQLQGAQRNYSATELEGLAIFKSVHFFAHFLYGRRFSVVTDHKALVAFLKSRVLNKRSHGWVLQLLDFDFEIIYRPGIENQDADALSRQAWDSGEGDPWRPAAVDLCEQPSKQSRSTEILVGGDVGTAHMEEEDVKTAQAKKEQKKEKDKEKGQEALSQTV